MSIEETFPIVEIQKLAKIESSRRQFYRPIYSLHKWWARRPGVTFRGIGLAHFLVSQRIFEGKFPDGIPFYLNHNLKNKIVLDPFMGGGTTIVEMNRLGLKTIGIDLNPVSWWTVKKELESFDEKQFNQAFHALEESIGEKIRSYYRTTCGNSTCKSKNANIMYCFWVKTVPCPSCSNEVELFKYYIIGKKQRGDPHTKVICPRCKDLFFTRTEVHHESTCPNPQCQHQFIPNNGNARKKVVLCSSCDQTFKLHDALQRQSTPLEANIIALEYYCDKCKTRGYKVPCKKDIELYQKAEKEFENIRTELLFPKDDLPSIGQTTNSLRNYNYSKFSDLFNKRQLLCLSLLLAEIKAIEDFNTREYLLAAFSSSLEFHTVLCPYNYTMKQIVNVFNVQGFLIPVMHVENNVWGVKKGNGTFITYIRRVQKAKEFCKNPFEVLVSSKKKTRLPIHNDKILANIVNSFQDLVTSNEPSAFLICGTSEDLMSSSINIPTNSVDAVITDPPYFSTIQYSELADFFFVWLKLVLSEDIDYFNQALSPKFNEIVMNKARKKDNESFLQGLTRVFSECNRVLKEKGPLIFTFHHKESLAWASVLGAILNSGFYITAVFPVVSEFRSRTVQSINYDAIIVCRKQTKIDSIIWEDLENVLYDQLDTLARKIRVDYNLLSKGDQMIILFGRCLEIVSAYPKIYEDELEISVEDLTVRILKIVDEKTVDEFLPDLDKISRIFLTVLVDQEIWSLDELNKRIRHQQIDLDKLLDEELIEKKDSSYYVKKPEKRFSYLDQEFKRGRIVNQIDKIHLLYYAYQHSGNFPEYVKKWRGEESLLRICEFLGKKMSDSTYQKIKKAITKQIMVPTELDFQEE